MKKLSFSTIRFIFILTICWFTSSKSYTQTCLPNGITFSQQYQIDNFSDTYDGCTHILGHVFIDGSTNNSITNLNGLSGLVEIGGHLKIESNYSLTSLSGLDQLESVGGDLEICLNINLPSLAALSSLDHVGGGIRIQANNTLNSLSALAGLDAIHGDLMVISCGSLTSLHGLHGIETIEGDLVISFCDGLINLNHLADLDFVGGHMDISYCDGLINLQGLQGLTEVGEYLYVTNNEAMTALYGLDFLASIGSSIKIENCPQLTTLSHLNNLSSIQGQVRVFNCDQLTNLTGLDNIDYTGISSLYIRNSAILSNCAVQSICDFLDHGGAGQATISNNANGCNTWGQVDNACQTLPVEWLSFEVAEKYPGIELQWSITGSYFTDHFVIQRSRNGTDFSTIDNVYPGGSSREILTYLYVDEQPCSGLNYYRILHLNQNGEVAPSNIRQWNMNKSRSAFYPNPTSGLVRLNSEETSGKQLIRITDLSGRIAATTYPLDDQMIDLTALPDGWYFLNLWDGQHSIVERVLKKSQ